MSSRILALVPRVVVAGLALALLASATLTFAAVKQAQVPLRAAARAKQARKLVAVPDVRGQAYVFAKGILEDAGFSWRVSGKVHGYPANLVVRQVPAPQTQVEANGAPALVLVLARNAHYVEHGAPEEVSPYAGTRIVLANAPSSPRRKKVGTKPKPTGKPAVATPKKPVARGSKAATKRTAVKPSRRAPARDGWPARRPPAFSLAGAPTEPLDEMPLPDRARLLGRWLGAHREATPGDIEHWSYQHAWVVAGAKFGWWHGADALRILIAVDRRAEMLWGLGTKSEAVARAALSAVLAER